MSGLHCFLYDVVINNPRFDLRLSQSLPLLTIASLLGSRTRGSSTKVAWSVDSAMFALEPPEKYWQILDFLTP
jgi:hypothetical protein